MAMPPRDLLEGVGLKVDGSVRWGEKPAERASGVYVVSLHEDPSATEGLDEAPLDLVAIERWIERVPTLTLSGKRPSPDGVAGHLARWWLADEAIVYIGKATSLHQRLGQYYSTPLGDRSPHAGGHWIKTLAILDTLWVHFSQVPAGIDPEDVEQQGLLPAFAAGVSPGTTEVHPEPGRVTPFANLTSDAFGARAHGIRKAVLR